MEEMNQLPFDVGGPGDREFAQEEGVAGQIPGYVEPGNRCAFCTHYEDGDGWCRKYRASCEPDGSCPSFEEAGDEADEEMEVQEPEMDGEVDD